MAERSLRLVGVVAPTPRRATSTIRQSSIVIRHSSFNEVSYKELWCPGWAEIADGGIYYFITFQKLNELFGSVEVSRIYIVKLRWDVVSSLCWSGKVIIGKENLRYCHIVTNISGCGDPAHAVRPRVHRVVSQTSRRVLGLQKRAGRLRYLEFYLDEFTFNRRRSRVRSVLCYRLKKYVVGDALELRQMILRDHPRLLGYGWVDDIGLKKSHAAIILAAWLYSTRIYSKALQSLP